MKYRPTFDELERRDTPTPILYTQPADLTGNAVVVDTALGQVETTDIHQGQHVTPIVGLQGSTLVLVGAVAPANPLDTSHLTQPVAQPAALVWDTAAMQQLDLVFADATGAQQEWISGDFGATWSQYQAPTPPAQQSQAAAMPSQQQATPQSSTQASGQQAQAAVVPVTQPVTQPVAAPVVDPLTVAGLALIQTTQPTGQ